MTASGNFVSLVDSSVNNFKSQLIYVASFIYLVKGAALFSPGITNFLSSF